LFIYAIVHDLFLTSVTIKGLKMFPRAEQFIEAGGPQSVPPTSLLKSAAFSVGALYERRVFVKEELVLF